MSDRTEVASIRLPRGTIKQLKILAHRLSLESGEDVTWSSLVRSLIDRLLLGHEAPGEVGASRG